MFKNSKTQSVCFIINEITYLSALYNKANVPLLFATITQIQKKMKCPLFEPEKKILPRLKIRRMKYFVTKIISGEYAIFEAHHECRESNAYCSSIVNTCICHCLNGYIAVGRHCLKGKNCRKKYFNNSVKSCYYFKVRNNL